MAYWALLRHAKETVLSVEGSKIQRGWAITIELVSGQLLSVNRLRNDYLTSGLFCHSVCFC